MTVPQAERKVDLYVYDLSRGMAAQFSQQLLGFHLDAIFHSSIVLGDTEYYYGHGLQYAKPGQTHHGPPMEIIPLGKTSIPDDVFIEYLNSIKSIYSIEAYDLFMHNCNHFTKDVAQFLCGCGIPAKIADMPQNVLDTPFGQIIKPMVEQALRPITTAPSVPAAPVPAAPVWAAPAQRPGVKIARSLTELEGHLLSAKESCAVVFFTSATCPPCKVVYPHFEQLAEEAGSRGVFVKVDVGVAFDAGSRYGIRATPTFMTFSKGERIEEWSGASPGDLKGRVGLLLQMTYPAHRHSSVPLPITLGSSMQPITYTKVPPLDKVFVKLGAIGEKAEAVAIRKFLTVRTAEGAIEAPIPDLGAFGRFLRECYDTEPSDVLFPLVDIFRAALVDPRVSGFFAEEKDCATISRMLTFAESSSLPYSLRLVTLQATCNLFTTPLFADILTASLAPHLISLITTSLLDKTHRQARVGASSLAFNVAVHIQKQRSLHSIEVFTDAQLVELVAAYVESLKEETESADVVKGLVLALALSVYWSPEGEVGEMWKVLEAGNVVRSKGKKGGLGEWGLCQEVARLLEC